jgi:hypothetical protein
VRYSEANMTIGEVEHLVAQFSPQQRIRFVARLLHELTVAARETYVPGSEEIAETRQLRAYNDMQHRAAACLWELRETETTEVWIWPFPSESSSSSRCDAAVISACERAYQFVRTRCA